MNAVLFLMPRPWRGWCCDASVSCSLFHVVVETDELAAKLIKELNKRRGGRKWRLHECVRACACADVLLLLFEQVSRSFR